MTATIDAQFIVKEFGVSKQTEIVILKLRKYCIYVSLPVDSGNHNVFSLFSISFSPFQRRLCIISHVGTV